MPCTKPFVQTVDALPVHALKARAYMRDMASKSSMRQFDNFNSKSVITTGSFKNRSYFAQREFSQNVRKNLLINATKHLQSGADAVPPIYNNQFGVKKKRVKNMSQDFRSTQSTALGPLARHYRVEDHRSRPDQHMMKVASSMHKRTDSFSPWGKEPVKRFMETVYPKRQVFK